MAATGVYKLDDGNYHPTNCFPARSLLQPTYKEGAGHWEVARHAAERSKFEWWFGSESAQMKWRELEKLRKPQRHLNEKTLTGTLLMKLHHVKSPPHLCSVDISNQNFVSAKEEDFEQFDSVAYVNANENLLTLEVFRKFPALRELELSLNGLRNLKVNAEDFPRLEILDLSYNNLSPEDIRALGVLPLLKALHLTANGLHSLPLDLAVPESKGCPRFPALEVLLLDDNHLSQPNVFVSLANLRNLKQLNLDRNGIKEVPYLHHVENSRFSIHPLSAKSGIKEGLRTRKSAEIQRKRDVFSRLGEQADPVVAQSSTDLDKREALFASCTPDQSVQRDTPLTRSVSKMSSTSFGQEFALPLTELRYLSLANNEIEQEEDLLAVALFPSLTELTFYGNPFTTSRSGDPPLLTSFLQNKLGIKLVRKKISKLEKPRIFIPVKANRKVKSPLPRVRKHPPMLEAPLETTFWQLWTGPESDLVQRASLDDSEPLPPISQFSVETRSSMSQPSFQEESGSEFQSMSSFPSEASSGPIPDSQTSLDRLCGLADEVPSALDQILSPPLPPRGSFAEEQSQSGLGMPSVSASAEEDLSQSLLPSRERSFSETDAPVETPLMEQGLPELVLPPESAEQEGNLLEHPQPTGPPSTEEDLSQVLQPISSAAGPPTAPPNSPSEQRQALSKPVPSTGSPPGEQDWSEALPTVGTTSGEQNLPETSPPTESPPKSKPTVSFSFRDQGLDVSEPVSPGTPPETTQSGLLLPPGPPLEKWDLVHLASSHALLSQGKSLSELFQSGIVPPPNSLLLVSEQLEPTPDTFLPQLQDLLEAISPSDSSSEDRDLSEPPPRVTTSSATQDLPESEPPTGSPFQEEVPPDSVPPSGPPVTEQDLTEPLPPPDDQLRLEASPSSGEQKQMGSHPSVVLTSPEPNRSAELLIQSPSMQQELPKSVPETGARSSGRSLTRGVSWAEPLLEKQSVSELSSLRSSSRDVHLLYERDLSLTSLSSERLDNLSSSDSLMREEMESFFMTQVAESSDHLEKPEMEETPDEDESAQLKSKPRVVPERYKGYEELLDDSADLDFIEPRGMHQNIKALEWALRHPLVYREPRARLDTFQKPYVPMEKKALRVPIPPAQKTKAQMLEELLQDMQKPNNIIELPLVCVLRKKKSNWREYREALALLNDFRKEYKAAVATARQPKSSHKKRSRRKRKKQSSRESQSQTPKFSSQSSRESQSQNSKVHESSIEVPPDQPSKDDKGLQSLLGEKVDLPPLGEKA